MPDEIRRIDYYYVAVPDKPGEGSRILTALRDAGINLLGVSAFPHGARRSQRDLIPEDGGAFAKAAKAAGLKLCKKKSGFLIQGEDRPGAVAEVAEKFAQGLSMSRLYKPSAPVPVATAVCCGLSPRNSGRLPKPSASDKACHASFITSARS